MEENLEIALKRAEAANLAKTEFIANMSHDVKTPLSGMISFSESLGAKVPQNLRKTTQDILGAGKQLLQFFDDCMELAKFENHAMVFSKETFNLKQLLSEIFTLFQPAIKAKGLFLYIDYSSDIPSHLLGSRVALYRVLLNLMGNAIKFTKVGSIKVSATLGKNSTAKKPLIKLTVADTGIGIPQNKWDLIFEKFSRLTPSYQGTYEGHGIGLYLVKEFVEAMQGEIHLESEVGKGSEFMVVIPFKKSLLADEEYKDKHDDIDLNLLQILPESNVGQNQAKILEQLTTISEPRREELALPKTGPRILVVEDTPLARDALEALLNGLGCQVETAEDGQMAIGLFKPGKYDLVFMDIGLPDMKGYDVSKHFREMEKGTPFNVPILGLSAHVSQSEEVLSFEAGMNEMLHKPLLEDQAKTIFEQYNLPDKLPSSSEQSEGNSENFSLFVKGKSDLRVIDLEKPKTARDLTVHEQSAWDILDEVITSFPETRTEIALLYKTLDTPQPQTEKLIATVHKFHGGICYTNTPDLLHTIRALETYLKAGKFEKNALGVLYQDFLDAMELLEKTYRSL
jgi:CheY-like chemotaxis protein